jgi:hypothetical protein
MLEIFKVYHNLWHEMAKITIIQSFMPNIWRALLYSLNTIYYNNIWNRALDYRLCNIKYGIRIFYMVEITIILKFPTHFHGQHHIIYNNQKIWFMGLYFFSFNGDMKNMVLL